MKIDEIVSQVWSAVNTKISNLTLNSLGGGGPLGIANGGTGATTATDAINNLINNRVINPLCIELTGASGHGGYIDFHYNGNSKDHDKRIIGSSDNIVIESYLYDPENDSTSNYTSLSLRSDTNTVAWSSLYHRPRGMSDQYPVYVANDAAHNALVENLYYNTYSLYTSITQDVPLNYKKGVYGAFIYQNITNIKLPCTYAHLLTSYTTGGDIAQLAINAIGATVYARSGTYSDGWRTPTYSDSNGWVRLAVTDTNGYVHSAVYN